MSIDIKKLEDLVTRTGEQTSEYRLAKQAGFLGMLAFGLCLVGLVGGGIFEVYDFGGGEIIMAISAAVGIAGVIGRALASMTYDKGRASVKVEAARLLAASASPATAREPASPTAIHADTRIESAQ